MGYAREGSKWLACPAIVEDCEFGKIPTEMVPAVAYYSENFPTEFTERQSMTLEQAVEYALGNESTESE